MKKSEEKRGGVGSLHNHRKIRIAVFGQHDVGKSALTVRYLTRRYIGEYKSNSDLLYRQTITLSRGNSLEIEIIDISTSTFCTEIGPQNPIEGQPRQTLPLEELYRSHGFIIVYSITDRSSFSIALQALEDIQCANSSPAVHSNPSRCPLVVTLIGNKCDLEHYRTVEKTEGISASVQYGKCSFYELSVAENYPEVYSSFQSIITSLSAVQPVPEPKPRRKYSIYKILENLRLFRSTSPSYPLTSNVSMTAVPDGGYTYSVPNSAQEGTSNSKGSCSVFQSQSKLHSIQ